MKKPVVLQAYFSPVLKACRNYGVCNMISSPQLVARSAIVHSARSIPTPQLLLRLRSRSLTTAASNSNLFMDIDMAKKMSAFSSSFPSYGDPCLDLFFNVKLPRYPSSSDPETEQHDSNCLNYLKQLLPLAWSHNPLLTLKLIGNLDSAIHDSGKVYREAALTALLWLHQNHPKTLLRNVDTFADSLGQLYHFVEILYALLIQEHSDFTERYERDPDFKLLHDRVVDAVVERLKSDIAKMKHNKLQLKPSHFTENGGIADDFDDDDDEFDSDDESLKLDEAAYADLRVSEAADICATEFPSEAPKIGAISLRESIARKLFPQKSDRSQEWERLRKEVLMPLKNYATRQGKFNTWRRCDVYHYLNELKSNAANIKPDALLPHQIIRYVNVGEAAERQWKAMVSDMSGKGKFKNCLAVCDITFLMGSGHRDLVVGLGLLVSQLSEEPWKGSVISSSLRPPQLLPIQGDDLKSNDSFLRSMTAETSVDIQKVFDLILEVAANRNLKPEQRIKKVFVFTDHLTIYSSNWENKYETIQSKFKDKGYEMPHIVFWDILKWWTEPSMPPTQLPGATMVTGFYDNLVKSFLDNGGEIAPHHLMEAAISYEEYQALAVVD